ncbi:MULTISPECIES: amino acid ABC transporter permease [unclassified Mesorhizobium]|uniref:amino acid ABC transporter permease n=1 Tax=unclassified Mesorhizobium TaxID=325217 RepID=UPI000F74F478|nr:MULTISPECIES: amino acid ABC transporter permease [unclassified Mesorhizobium]AZO28467.1 amino acid ABC transporter permease [Mesorhizobium sp. M1B.F.Ca.ET.045.04.1.1]RWA81805.1 MAG: ABC transporter permease subunit [Mesorhizobium sp.]RWB18704.1 MAG: ABC transporter permease subunit [Mesorhizobium sp.]RWE03172.1 MAG: ABC transporter permease subunit [Mesorhizobium sp.]TIT90712.1 MAG: ABC transporter permease subunit [Mesorhizobium sp.]
MEPIGENELFFLLQGLKWTILLAVIGFLGGGAFGVLIALLRTAQNRVARTVTTGYIAVFQGTPLLMQLFVVYYGVALLGVDVNAWIAVAIAFTLHASAFLGEIWRGAIEAVPRGQTEAAKALGLHYVSRMKDVVLPQALKISMPATIGFLVQLIKGTSLAAIVGFIELTRAGQIVSNQTYRPLLVFGIVGLIYFIICWPLSHLGSGIEKRMAKAAR